MVRKEERIRFGEGKVDGTTPNELQWSCHHRGRST